MSDEEDDYMKIPVGPVEPEHPEPKQDIERKEKPLESERGMRLMKLMGYKPGESLGKDKTLNTEPIAAVQKQNKAGVGAETAVKRKLLEQHDEVVQSEKQAKLDYQQSKRNEIETRRLANLQRQAQDVLIDFLSKQDPDAYYEKSDLQNMPVEVRGLVGYHQARQALIDSRNARFHSNTDLAQDNSDTDDAELDEFQTLPVEEQLDRVTDKLRSEYLYCFWCAAQYTEDDINECPGLREKDH